MSNKNNWKTPLPLLLTAMMFLTTCSGGIPKDAVVIQAQDVKPLLGAQCPPYPSMSAAAKAELKLYCFPSKTLTLCPATLDWLNKVDVLKHQLAECSK